MIKRTRTFRHEALIDRPMGEVFDLARVPWHPQLRELVDLSPRGEAYSQWRMRVGRSWIRGQVVEDERPLRWVTRSGCRGVAGTAETLLEPLSAGSTRYIALGSVTISPQSMAYWFISGRTASRATDVLFKRWEKWAQAYDGPLPVPPSEVIVPASGGSRAKARALAFLAGGAIALSIGVIGNKVGAAWWENLLASVVGLAVIARLWTRNALHKMSEP